MEAVYVDMEQLVKRYFELVRALRKGDEESVDQLMELWDVDGSFEFVGAPPVVASFKGAAAIRALYKNRLNSSGMRFHLRADQRPRDPADSGDTPMHEDSAGDLQEVSLGIVDTDVTHIRANGERAVVGWRTTIGTEEGIGFDVAGSHQFVLDRGKIKNLRVSVSPKPDQSRLENLRFEGLDVVDVGRLSLAAWMVV